MTHVSMTLTEGQGQRSRSIIFLFVLLVKVLLFFFVFIDNTTQQQPLFEYQFIQVWHGHSLGPWECHGVGSEREA